MKQATLIAILLRVVCGLAAGAWLGAAEAPTKLVTMGFSPFVISPGMVARHPQITMHSSYPLGKGDISTLQRIGHFYFALPPFFPT